MAIRLVELRWLALDPDAQARFWAEVLGVPSEAATLEVPGFTLRFVATDRPRSTQGRIHLDLTSTSVADQRSQVATVLRLGGRHADVGQSPQETHVVLADPEGNELCVIAPGNRFLAGTGRVGAVNCDGTHDLGVFWSRALAWPLVWDENQETSIQSPLGGTKVSWGGPPVEPKHGRNRQRFDLVSSDPAYEVERLVSLGATRRGDQGAGVELADPDGNEFSLRAG